MAFTNVATTEEMGPNTAKQVVVNGKKLALFNRDGAFYAIDDTCTHRGGRFRKDIAKGPW